MLGKNTVKDIDKQRLQELYIIDGVRLIRPEQTAKFLGIDEFKLHNGYKYATHIIDMETGHILWISPGKKKQVVYDFIEYVGIKWMDNVEAVACDMDSDFQEAFEEKCPHIQTERPKHLKRPVISLCPHGIHYRKKIVKQLNKKLPQKVALFLLRMITYERVAWKQSIMPCCNKTSCSLPLILQKRN